MTVHKYASAGHWLAFVLLHTVYLMMADKTKRVWCCECWDHVLKCKTDASGVCLQCLICQSVLQSTNMTKCAILTAIIWLKCTSAIPFHDHLFLFVPILSIWPRRICHFATCIKHTIESRCLSHDCRWKDCSIKCNGWWISPVCLYSLTMTLTFFIYTQTHIIMLVSTQMGRNKHDRA